MFRALLVDRSDDGFSAGLTELDDDALPEGDVLVDVAHSTVNYKDGLAVTNASPIVRSFPPARRSSLPAQRRSPSSDPTTASPRGWWPGPSPSKG